MSSNNNRTLHETVLKDITDLLTGAADVVNTSLSPKRNYRSIASVSEKMTLVFPVFVSSNIRITDATMVSKAIERKCVTMLQMLFAEISITDTDNVIDFIARFHGNLHGEEIDIDTLMDAVSEAVNEGAITVSDKEMYDCVMEDMKNINFTLPDAINETSLNDYRVNHNRYGSCSIYLSESEADKRLREKLIRQGVIRPKKNTTQKEERKSYEPQKPKDNIRPKKNTTQKEERKLHKPQKPKDNKGYRTKIYSDMSDLDRAKTMKTMMDMERDRVFSTDIKKANELVPTMMVINIYHKETKLPITAVIGIKAKLYPLNSEDIIDHLVSKNRDNNGFLNLIKATTREISFWRDFVFAVDKAKIDAVSSSKRGSASKVWKVLERRALIHRLKRALGRITPVNMDSAAISTVVVSQEDVEQIKKNYNIDIERPATIRPIMDDYSLMGFAIVDPTLETVKFIFDTGDDNYETMSYNALERESNDSNYKRVINLLSRVAR